MNLTKRQVSRPGKRPFFVECDSALAARVVRLAANSKPEPLNKSAWIRRAMIEKADRDESK